MMIMRELTGGLYFGKRSTADENGELVARDSMSYSETEIRRIAKRAFDIAMKRNKKVTSVDKANVIDTSRLWRKVVSEVAKDYPEVTLEHMLVDNCAMQLVKDPKQFEDAQFIPHTSYLDVLNKKLKVMDSTAISLCMEEEIPILVFNIHKSGNLRRLLLGENVGSTVS